MIRFKLDGKTLFSLTRLELKECLASLKNLLVQVRDLQQVPLENAGICANWESDFSYALVSYFGSKWPKSARPGRRHPYPIASNGTPLWEGINKELRIDLMEFIINELEQLIEKKSSLTWRVRP